MNDLGALANIEHVVVLMQENRSFDSMLGYLALDSTYDFQAEIDGIDPTMHNVFEGVTYQVHPFANTAMASWETPEHDGPDVARQLAGGGAGFVQDFVETRGNDAQRTDAAKPETCCVMGYHTREQLPVYDHLARSYTVCNRWFASVPGATMPNRLYSVCGTAGGLTSNQKLFGKDFPLYHLPSFIRHLRAGTSWKWYRQDALIPSTLSLFDPRYRTGHDDNFALYSHFGGDCADGRLANVSWIEPGFFDKFGLQENDDHPPTDVTRGQQLVHDVCDALLASPSWPRTLLVIVYDEHGGCFDHVPSPVAADDDPAMRRYGVRVPAIVVSPYARPGVCSTIFDHTSILRTVLDLFSDEPKDVMGARVAAAENLSSALQPAPRAAEQLPARPGPAPAAAVAAAPVASWQHLADLIGSSRDGTTMTSILEQDLGHDDPGGRPIDDLQRGLIVAAGELSHLDAGPSDEDLAER